MNRPVLKRRVLSDKERIKALRRRVNKARDFPTHTCPASRHLHIMADCLTSKEGVYHMLNEEPAHCAESIYAVLASLWEARKELTKLKNRPMSNRTNTKEKT